MCGGAFLNRGPFSLFCFIVAVFSFLRSHDVGADFAPEFTIEGVRKIVEAPGVESVETFLKSELLPQAFRTRFKALKQAIMLQPATPLEPRIIAYGNTARFIFTFNGGKPGSEDKGPVNEALEIMQWNPTDRAFDFYHVEFFPGTKTPTRIDGPDGPVIEGCLDCHHNRTSMGLRSGGGFTAQDTENFISKVIEKKHGSLTALRRYEQLEWKRQTPDELIDLIEDLKFKSRQK